MKKSIRVLSLLLTGAMVMSMAACTKETEETKKKKKKKDKETTTTEETTTEEPETTTTEEPTTESTEESTSANASGNPDFKAPDPGCEIAYLAEDERFHYTMDLTLDTEENTIGGHVVINFYNYSDTDWDKICLRDYSSLFIDAETADYDSHYEPNGAITEITNIKDESDQSAIELEREDDVSVIWFKLPHVLASGESMTLSYDFVAKIPTVADRYGVEAGVFNITNFYPILAVYEEKDHDWSHAPFYCVGECFYSNVSDYDVTLTTPKDVKVLSSGVTQEAKEDGNNMVYTINAPCVRDFVFSAAADFIITSEEYNGVTINVAYSEADSPIKNMDSAVATSIQASKDSLDAFGEYFGKYPYPELDVILAPISAGGMEYPNLVIIESSYCSMPTTLSEVIAHEIGHQWFMGIVGSNSGMQPWQDESFASYTEIAYYEYCGDDDDMSYYEDYISRDVFDLADPYNKDMLASMGYTPINMSHYEYSDDDTYCVAVYQVGQYALFQMEEILGRDEFHAVIREYVQRNAFQNAHPEDFFEVLYEYAGTDNEDLNALIEAVFDMSRVDL